MSKVLIIDTSILCVFLRVPDMDDCGPDSDKWDYNRVCRKLEKEIMSIEDKQKPYQLYKNYVKLINKFTYRIP